MYFQSWESIYFVVITAALIYLYIVFLLRISGKRTLAQMNAFDFVVSVAIGSIMSSAIVFKDVVLWDGIAALTTLVILQYILARFTSLYAYIDNIVKSKPEILFYRGDFVKSKLSKLRVAEDEIYEAVRQEGILYLEEVEAVVLETNGKFSVLKKSDRAGKTSLPE